jgi:anti-anti-sigma factor
MSNPPFRAEIRQLNQIAVIDLFGEINAFADPRLSEAYNEAQSANPQMVVLNFAKVEYINSTGIALVVGLLALARKTGRKLAVFGLSPHYLQIFQITRLSDFMQIYSDEASALKGVADPSTS